MGGGLGISLSGKPKAPGSDDLKNLESLIKSQSKDLEKFKKKETGAESAYQIAKQSREESEKILESTEKQKENLMILLADNPESIELIKKQNIAADIIKANFSKEKLHTLLITLSCVLFNVYIDGENEGLRMYKEEVVTLRDQLESILNKHCAILADYFATDIDVMKESLEFKEIPTDAAVIKQDATGDTLDPNELKTDLKGEEAAVEEEKDELKENEDVLKAQDPVLSNDNNQPGEINQNGGDGDESVQTNDGLLKGVENEKLTKLITELSENMANKNLLIRSKLTSDNFTFYNDIQFFLRVVLFISKFINLLNVMINEDESIGKLKPAGPEGEKKMLQGKVILAKSKVYGEMSKIFSPIAQLSASAYNRVARKEGGGVLSSIKSAASSIKTAAKNTGTKLVTGTKQFFSKADEEVKEKYSFLLYFNSFLTMYIDNSFSRQQLSSGKRTFLSSMYDMVLVVYRYGSKNPLLGTLIGSLQLATNVTFYAACVPSPIQPFLLVAAGGLATARTVAVIVCLPFIDPAKIKIYKQVEIEMYNDKIKNRNIKQDKIDEVAKQYAGLMEKLFTSKLNFTLDCAPGSKCEEKKLKQQQGPAALPAIQSEVEKNTSNTDFEFEKERQLTRQSEPPVPTQEKKSLFGWTKKGGKRRTQKIHRR